MNGTALDETHGAKLAKIELKKKSYRSAAVGLGRSGHLKHRYFFSGLTWKKKGMGGSFSSKIWHVYVHIRN